jgi:sugar/nucleoside kinase (ribokinase family)
MAKILGIGNALVDVLNKLENDELLKELGLPKGSMQLVEEKASKEIDKKSSHLKRERASGGSAANTIHGLANLGIETAFIGTVGDDETGRFFSKDMINSGIKPMLNLSKTTSSGIANAMISPDGERTFGTYLGASIELSPKNISVDLFNGYSIIYVEGYLVQNHELLEKILKTAKEAGTEVALDLASYNVVEDNLDFLKMMVEQYVDILFANEEEAKAFTGKEPEEALEELSKVVKLVVVKIGSRGSLIKSGDTIVKVGTEKTKVVDTTGAGDLFAAGFLYGYINNLSLKRAGEIGSMLAAKVIADYGAKINKNDWKEMKSKL